MASERTFGVRDKSRGTVVPVRDKSRGSVVPVLDFFRSALVVSARYFHARDERFLSRSSGSV